MGRRRCKSIFCILLAGFWLSCLWGSGCTDNPDAKAAKEMRKQTALAVQMSAVEKDYEAAQQKVLASLERGVSGGLTKDTALLASGNLAMAKGQQIQADLDAIALQIRTSTNKLEDILRSSEDILIEKERGEMLLAVEDQEIAELGHLLNGEGQLNEQLEQVDAKRRQLLSQRASMQAEKERVQGVLDEYQSKADDLMRQAELTKGDARLDLENQAFALLRQRKAPFVEAQSLENQVTVLDSDIALVQTAYDGVAQSIREVQQRIDAVEASPTRVAFKQQIRDMAAALADSQQRLTAASSEVATALAAYRKASERACAEYGEAIDEFKKIPSGKPKDAAFAATVRLADAAYHSATACSRSIRIHKDLSGRLQGLLDTAEPVFVSAMQTKLPMQQAGEAESKKKAFAHFDQAIETYEKAFAQAGQMSDEVRCSLLKSKLLALYAKMQLADLVEDFNLADSVETAMDAVIEKGNELGAAFTQSETMRVVMNGGLDYLPSLPLNMAVFVEGKKQEFSEWKRLPVNEQEAAVDAHIQEIDELIAQYGQDVAPQLEPLKREMLAAKERGFKESAGGGGPGDPNSL